MNELTISVILPTYNRAMFIDRAIVSVLRQINSTDEFIVIDDGSTDNTEKIVAKYGKKIKYIKTSNRGSGCARNLGVNESKKDLICFIDSDDEWLNHKVKIQRKFMSVKEDVLFCFTNFRFVNKQGIEKRFNLNTWHDDNRKWSEILDHEQKISNIIELPDAVNDFNIYMGNIYKSALKFGNYLNVNTLIVRRKEAGKTIRFADDINVYEEYECLARMARNGNCCYMDIETARQYAHHNARLTDADGFERNNAQLRVIERVWGNDYIFLNEYGDEYKSITNSKRLDKIGYHFFRGEKKLAVEELKKIETYPLKYKILKNSPKFFIKLLGNLRREFIKKRKKRALNLI